MHQRNAALLSSTGAGVLGFGLGAMLAQYAAGAAIVIIIIGIVMHGTGMYYTRQKEDAPWMRILSWACWLLLFALLAYLLMNMLR